MKSIKKNLHVSQCLNGSNYQAFSISYERLVLTNVLKVFEKRFSPLCSEFYCDSVLAMSKQKL